MIERRLVHLIFYFIVLFLIAGCEVTDQGQLTTVSETVVLEKSITPLSSTATPTNAPQVEFTSTPTILPVTVVPTPSPSWTPLPTLTIDDAQRLVKELLESNAGCRLPCWWGFTPGQTPWEEAEHFLTQVAQYIGTYNEETENTFKANAKIHTPAGAVSTSWESVPYLTQDYFVQDGIIQTINVFNFDLALNYALPAFLKNYGQPSGVWIRTFREEEQNSQPYAIDIFYQEQGILMEFSGGDGMDLGESLRNCLDDSVNSPFMYLWSPDNRLNFTEAKVRFLDTENLPEPVSLQEATGMSVEEFYSNIINTGQVCIETPKVLWP